MKLIILSIAILGAFLAPTLASVNINERNQGNVGGHTHQSVSIDNQRQVVNVDDNNGWQSWNTVWDYKSGYLATRFLSTKSCIIAKMNPEIMPDVTTLPQAIKEKQKASTKEPDHKITYMISSKKIADLTPYGKSIEALCRGIPTFPAYEVKGQSFFYYSGSCFEANILCLLGIHYCGEKYDY
ncbi:gastrokine-1 [Sceloporus undulatus]|uniref:gastrokine-1 n=1 Tax=Sceloporus undulatus TaxID=8520 RepID=UPI001C4DA9F2|nr:gastrokine-1 [Sceloporus undulatus]